MKARISGLPLFSRIIPARIYPVRYFYLTGCYKYTSGTQLLAYSTQTWSSGMPSSFGSCTKAAYQAAIYAVYTPITQPVELAPQGLIGNPYMFTGRRFDLETTELFGPIRID
jgi:hypothetical protein